MRTLHRFVLAAGAVLALACGDDDGNGPNRDAMLGSWNVTSMVFTLTANPAIAVDAVADLGATASFVATADNDFILTVTFPGEPVEVITGTWSLDGDVVTVSPDGEAFDWEFDVTLVGNTLYLEGAQVEFDIDDDGTEDGVTLDMVLQRAAS